MLDIARNLSASASVQALTGSSRPGAVSPLLPLDAVTSGPAAGQAGVAHPDAKVIHLAERVAALAPVSLRAAARRAERAAVVDAKLPTLSPMPQPENRTKIENQSIEGWYIATFSYPTTPDEAHAAAMKVWDAEVAEGKRIEAALQARHRIPQWEALELRTNRRLIRRAWRLTYMRPKTQEGLKAKAAAAVAVMQTGASDIWANELHASVSRDALRIIGAEADKQLRADQARDGELLALGRLWDESCQRDDQTHIALVEAEDRYNAPSPPEVLFNLPGEAGKLGPYPNEHVPTGRYWYGDRRTIDALRRVPPTGISSARRAEIVQAYDAWIAADTAERDRSGLTAARAAVDATISENAALRARICRTPARTLAGTDLKLRVVLWLSDGLEFLEAGLQDGDFGEPEHRDAVALSMALDLARMGRGSMTSAEPARAASAA